MRYMLLIVALTSAVYVRGMGHQASYFCDDSKPKLLAQASTASVPLSKANSPASSKQACKTNVPSYAHQLTAAQSTEQRDWTCIVFAVAGYGLAQMIGYV